MNKEKVEIVSNNTYIKPKITKEWLIKNNFKYNKILSDIEEEIVYTYRFPVHKSGCFTILECELSCIESTGKIKINVYDYGTRVKYAAFYQVEYGNYTAFLKNINRKINEELKRFGIKKLIIR